VCLPPPPPPPPLQGFPSADLAEMHGCGNLEYCPMCGQEYLRDFQATLGRRTCGARLKREMWPEHSKLDLINPRKGNHYTGRRCTVPGCAGWLFDSTIDFGDNLPERALDKAAQLAADATLCVVIGSRCAVTPAADFPISVGERKGGTLVVVNLQRTAADGAPPPPPSLRPPSAFPAPPPPSSSRRTKIRTTLGHHACAHTRVPTQAMPRALPHVLSRARHPRPPQASRPCASAPRSTT
jgi:hypothetical protein